MRDNKGRFAQGELSERRMQIGSIVIRTRHKRGGEQRAWVKVANPNVWKLLAQHVWEQEHGPIPEGFGVHHKDRNKLNDALANLELKSKAEHLSEHREEFVDRAVAGFVAARKARRWSTKSKTKRTGAPPTWTDEAIASAIDACLRGEPISSVSSRTGISRTTLYRKIRGSR